MALATISEVESEIVTQLQAQITDLKTDSFPDKPESFKNRLLNKKGMLLVRYMGSTYSSPVSPQDIIQARTMTFMIVVSLKSLRDHDGIYDYLDAVKVALSGFTPSNCKKLYPTREQFVNHENGIWTFGIIFETKCKYREVLE